MFEDDQLPPPPQGAVPIEDQLPPPPPGATEAPAGPANADLIDAWRKQHPYLNMPLDLIEGIGSGALSTARGLSQIAHGVNSSVPVVRKELATPPDSAMGKTGYYGEQAGEFLLPGGAISKADKAIEAAKLAKPLEVLAKGATEALPAAAITYGQTGGNTDAALVAGGGAGALKMALPVAGEWVAAKLGKKTGVGEEAIKKAAQNSPDFQKGLSGELTEGDILQTARDALEAVKEQRRVAYQSQLQNLPQVQLNIKPALGTFVDGLKSHGIKYQFDPKTNQLVLDFSRSPVKTDAQAMQALQETANDLWGWGTKPGDLTTKGVDALKQIIDRRFNPKMAGRAVIEATKNSVRSILDRVPGYQEMTKDYALTSKLLDNMGDLSLNAKNDGTAIRKLTTVLNQNNAYRSGLLDELSQRAGVDIGAQIAGNRMNTWAPRGIAGPLHAAFDPQTLVKWLAAVTLSSPRPVATIVRRGVQAAPYAPRAVGSLPSMILSGTQWQPPDSQYALGGAVDDDGSSDPVLRGIVRRRLAQAPAVAPGRPALDTQISVPSDTSFSDTMSQVKLGPEWLPGDSQPFLNIPTVGGSPMSLSDIVQLPQSKLEAGLLAAGAVVPPAKALKAARGAVRAGTKMLEGAAPEVGVLSRAIANTPRSDITAEEILKAAAAGPGKFGSYAKYMERNPTAGADLFDSSNPKPTFPNRPPVARYDPSVGRGRGPSARVVDAFNNPKVIEGLKDYARRGAEMLPADWYANDPLLNVYQREWGPQAEEKFYQQMGHQAATSTGSAVPDNLRTGSYYNYLHEQGIPFPEKPAPGYGSKYQKAHRDTALNFRDTGTVDPIDNPKRASFTENLMGNEDLLTADKHFMRLVGILSEDPRFLKTTAEVSRNGKLVNIKPQELYKRGKLTMEDAVKDPNLWVEAPNANEYLHLENEYRNKVAQPLGYSVANAQGKDWVGGGELTGLGSPPEAWIELLKHRVQYTADRLNVDPQVILRKFVRGEIPLLELGAGAAGLGALSQYPGQASDTDRTRTGVRP